MQKKTSLQFPLLVEDDWPPFGSESLPFQCEGAEFRLLSAPLFVKDLSVDDIINAIIDEKGFVSSWHHVKLSARTVIWLLRLKQDDQLEHVLGKLRRIGCNTVGLSKLGCFSVDVPENIAISSVDDTLSSLDSEKTAIAFPSFRHEDDSSGDVP